MVTDDYKIYDHLDDMERFVHVSTKHSDGEYSKAYIHNNTAEGLFSDLRPWPRRYKGACMERLYRFVGLFQFRYNNRWLKPIEQFMALLATLIRR